ATTNKVPVIVVPHGLAPPARGSFRQPWSWLLAAERADVDRAAQLGLEVLAQPPEQPLLELAGALAAHSVLIADLLQRQGLVGEQALAKDGLLASFQRLPEGLELLAQQALELGLG